MALAGHGRYAYVPITRRQPYDWPNGTRLAVFIALNLEHFPFGEGLGVALAPAQPASNGDDVLPYQCLRQVCAFPTT